MSDGERCTYKVLLLQFVPMTSSSTVESMFFQLALEDSHQQRKKETNKQTIDRLQFRIASLCIRSIDRGRR